VCRALRAHTRQLTLFQYLGKVLPCGLGDGQVLEKSGERGRNRTFDLLIKSLVVDEKPAVFRRIADYSGERFWESEVASRPVVVLRGRGRVLRLH
jgi:hypothetical protein